MPDPMMQTPASDVLAPEYVHVTPPLDCWRTCPGNGQRTASSLVSPPHSFAAYLWSFQLVFVLGLSIAYGKSVLQRAYPCGFARECRARPVLVDSTPQVLAFALNRHSHLIEKPTVTTRAAPFPETPRVVQSERCAPLPNRFIRHDDIALCEKVFDVS